MKQLIEGRVGEEWHTSSWGKFYMHGVSLVAEGRVKTRHETYTSGALEVEDGTLLTVWASAGNKRGTDSADFYILLTDASAGLATIENGYGELTGRWQVLAHGDGPTRAGRLLGWAKGKELTVPLARHLGEQIRLRGKAQPDPLPV
jgi:hypothetical protein